MRSAAGKEEDGKNEGAFSESGKKITKGHPVIFRQARTPIKRRKYSRTIGSANGHPNLGLSEIRRGIDDP